MTSPAPARNAPRAASRAAPVAAMPPDTTITWPRAYLWPSTRGTGKPCARAAGCFQRSSAGFPRSTLESIPISATRTRPHMMRPGNNRCAGLRRKNVTVSVARTATPMTAPVVPLMPLGRSTLEHRRAVGVDRLDHVRGLARHRPVETGAEQRIDDQRRLADRLRIERQHRIFPSPRGGGRIALQAVPLAQQDHRDLAAARRQFGRRDKTVAAIVAAARQPPGSAPSSTRSIAASATAWPALSINAKPGVPAAMVSRSARSISAVVRTSMPNPC